MADPAPQRLTGRLGFRLGLVLSIALLPVGLLAVLQSDRLIDEVRARSETALMGETLRAAAPETRLIRQAQGAVAAVSAAMSSLSGQADDCRPLMQSLIAPGSLFGAAAFVGPDGAVRCVSPEDGGTQFGTLPLTQMGAGPGPALSAPQTSQDSGPHSLFASHPVIDSAGALTGFLSLAVPSTVFEQAAEQLEPKSDLAIVVFDGAGQVLAANEPIDSLLRLFPSETKLQTLADRGSATFTAPAVSGEQRAFSVVSLAEPGLFALGSWPAREAATLWPALPPAAFPALMWAVSLIAAYLAAELLVTRHIRDLRGAIMRFAGGQRAETALDMSRAPREIRDVSEAFVQMTHTIRRDEAELEHALHQKEALLREVHHRVKNNLQLVASIISMQIRETTSGEARQMMRAVQDRVLSLATVHRDLFLTSHLTEVKADELLPEVVNRVVNLAVDPDRSIEVQTEFADVALNADQAVPLALLLAEAVTQARNEAAGDGGVPRLDITLRRDGPDHAVLSVGHAIEASALVAPGETMRTGLGGQLIDAFAAQLGGTVRFEETRGSHQLNLLFPLSGAATPPAADQ